MNRLGFRFPEMDERLTPIVIVGIGPPGAGKGTQSSMLANLLRVPHVSIGSLLRSCARDEIEVGLRLKGMMALGDLVPDTLVLDVLATRIGEPDCARGLILDGFPPYAWAGRIARTRTIEIAILFHQPKGEVGCPSPSRAKQHNCVKTLRAPYLFSLWSDLPPRNPAATGQR